MLDHRPSFTNDQRALFDRLVRIDGAQPLAPVPFEDVASEVRRSAVTGAGKAFDTMLASNALVKVGDELYRGSQIRDIRARMEGFLRTHDRMTVAEFRDAVGTTRKYAVPLMEWFDATGVTVRDGDLRALRARPVAS